jgi:hypothetical protein
MLPTEIQLSALLGDARALDRVFHDLKNYYLTCIGRHPLIDAKHADEYLSLAYMHFRKQYPKWDYTRGPLETFLGFNFKGYLAEALCKEGVVKVPSKAIRRGTRVQVSYLSDEQRDTLSGADSPPEAYLLAVEVDLDREDICKEERKGSWLHRAQNRPLSVKAQKPQRK